jgi:alpha 1,6-mannosyltransferase
MNPTFVHRVIPDEALPSMVQDLYAAFPEVLQTFNLLPLPVLRADFFRYLVLLAQGGVYSDIDTTALKPVEDWIPQSVDRHKIGIVVGIEADPDRPDWKQWYSRRIQFCQWTIQSLPGHPILVDIVASIVEESMRMRKAGLLEKGQMDRSVVEFTGPAAWTDAVFRFFNGLDSIITHENFTNQAQHQAVGDVLVLPITSFSPGVGHMGSQGVNHPLALVKHDFQGTLSVSLAYRDRS